eukprot:g4338.t1
MNRELKDKLSQTQKLLHESKASQQRLRLRREELQLSAVSGRLRRQEAILEASAFEDEAQVAQRLQDESLAALQQERQRRLRLRLGRSRRERPASDW